MAPLTDAHDVWTAVGARQITNYHHQLKNYRLSRWKISLGNCARCACAESIAHWRECVCALQSIELIFSDTPMNLNPDTGPERNGKKQFELFSFFASEWRPKQWNGQKPAATTTPGQIRLSDRNARIARRVWMAAVGKRERERIEWRQSYFWNYGRKIEN